MYVFFNSFLYVSLAYIIFLYAFLRIIIGHISSDTGEDKETSMASEDSEES